MITYYIIYKITNQISGKIYIGSHKTKNLNDSYMGSGKYLKRAQDKHGIENFTKEILFIFDNPGEMYAKEAEIVNEDFLIEENTYNLKVGGFGGWSHVIEQGKNKNFDWSVYRSSEKYKESQQRGYENGIGKKGFVTPKFKGNEFLGKNHSDSAKKAIGEKNSKHQTGVGNSQFGKMWITNGQENLKICKTDPIPDEYRKGRVLKKII